eukprot:TRINITY_DN40760_c0_g1_i1.p1 TRINITY_DN40760_c0_g1~~TRINITY_DN40760_c0_g1_i1.p1  ORF type:complete len:422 (-),score=-18.18 TRINITY_DN40760_c0_g1_i1:227-1492(-)
MGRTLRPSYALAVAVVLLSLVVSVAVALAPTPKQGACDFSVGRWLPGGKRFPRYTDEPGQSNSCPYIRSEFACDRNHRPDQNYQWYRWQPQSCLFSYFSPAGFKYMMRGKKILLVGDSMMSNFYEALLCAIHNGGWKGEPYVRNTNGTNNIKGVRFPRLKMSVEHLFSPYLVDARTRTSKTGVTASGAPKRGGHGYDINLDRVNPTVESILAEYDVAVFASGVWWQQNVPRRKQPNQFLVGGQYRNLSNVDAHAWALNTLASFVKKIDFAGVPFFLSFSPHHGGSGRTQAGVYPNGEGAGKDWQGACGAIEPMSERMAEKKYGEPLATSEEYLTTQKATLLGTPFRFLQVTRLSAMRPDGHQGLWYKSRAATGPTSPGGDGEDPFSGDCTHWCLPGVPDTWVDMLYTNMLLEPSLVLKGKK